MNQFVLLIGALGTLMGAGGLAAVLKTRSDNRKTVAEAEVTLGGGWELMWKSQRDENNELRERVAIIEASEKECHARLARLESKGDVDIESTVVGLIDKEIAKRGGSIDAGITGV